MPFERLIIDQNRSLAKRKPWDQWAYDYANAADDSCFSLRLSDHIAEAAHRKWFERGVRERDPDATDDLIEALWEEFTAMQDAEAEHRLLCEMDPDPPL